MELRRDMGANPAKFTEAEAPDKRRLVRPEGFEPSTYGSEVRRSIQLSYGRNICDVIITQISSFY